MDRIAFIVGEVFIYWHSVILTCGVLTAIFLFLALWLDRGGSWRGGLLAVPVSLALSMVLARLIHWYSMSATYASFWAAMTDYTSGGFALMGVFIGCILAACLLRLCKVHEHLLRMLDCMSLAGMAGVAVGRLADLFTNADLGMLLQGITVLPFARPVQDALTGEMTYRLATFMLQAIVAALIFGALLIAYILRGKGKLVLPDGDLTLLMLLLYCPSQVILDSTRYDSLFFRGNGFVSIVQVLCAVGLGVSIIWFSVRMVKDRGWKYWYIGLWLAIAAGIGGAGYMEYHVQRYGHQAVFAYSMMTLLLVIVIALTLVVRRLSLWKPAALVQNVNPEE